MSQPDLPFRPTPEGSLSPEATETLVRIQDARSAARPMEGLGQVIDTADDLVLFELAHAARRKDAVFAAGVDSRPSQIERLIRRALARAAEQDALWTPTLDALARSGEWQGDAEKDLPSPTEQAERLAPWIAEQGSRAPVEELLRFRAEAVRVQIARHARSLEPAALLLLLESRDIAQALRQNPHLGADADAAIMRRAYAQWKEEIDAWWTTGQGFYEAGSGTIEMMQGLLEDGVTVPAPLREEMCADLVAGRTRALAADVLLRDPELEPDQMERILDSGELGSPQLTLAAAHPSLSVERFLELVQDTSLATHILLNTQLPASRLQVILDEHDPTQDAMMALGLSTQAEAPLSVLRTLPDHFERAEKSTIYNALAANPAARADPCVRAVLRQSSSLPVIAALLDGAAADEFGPLIRRLWSASREEAVKWLSEHGVREGARLPEPILRALLSSSDRSERLIALTLLGQDERSETRKPPRR